MSDPQSLKNMGLKATFPRLKILELFETSTLRHMSAEDVYKMLIAENMDIGLATVYRVLTQFEQAGLLERHFFESGKAVFEINHGKHVIAEERGFAIQDHALYLYAQCTKTECPHRNNPGAKS